METAHISPSIWKIFFQPFDSNKVKIPSSGNQISEGSDDPVIADVAGQLDQIQAAKDVLNTPKRKTRFNPVDEVINIAVETQSIALPKRMKFEKLGMMVKSENPDETRARVIGTIIEQWDEITSQVEELYNVLNDRTVADQKFREKIISNNW